MPSVRGDLARFGYASVPLQLSAGDVGAWHRRRRVFVLAHTNRQFLRQLSRRWSGQGGEGSQEPAQPSRWPAVPTIERAADGVPDRVDRLRTLGNAVVPAVAARAFSVLAKVCDSS